MNGSALCNPGNQEALEGMDRAEQQNYEQSLPRAIAEGQQHRRDCGEKRTHVGNESQKGRRGSEPFRHAFPLSGIVQSQPGIFSRNRRADFYEDAGAGDSNAVPCSRPHPRLVMCELNCTCVIQTCLTLWVHPTISQWKVMTQLRTQLPPP